jgi:O-methyltransferase
VPLKRRLAERRLGGVAATDVSGSNEHLTALEAQLAAQVERNRELQDLLAGRPPRPAVPRFNSIDLQERIDDEAIAQMQRVRYLELLKACLTRILFLNDEPGVDALERAHAREVRRTGKDFPPPPDAETMIGMLRLDAIQMAVETVLREEIPGDLLEAGVWRGGATILMRAVLAVHGVGDRRVWVCDSFEGLPPPDAENFPQDVPEDLSAVEELAVSQAQVRANFARYDLLDDQVVFVEGWFKDTLSTVPVESLAVLRLDGDYYESTIQIFEALYDKVVPGGFIIVDDYGCIPACAQAVTDFRTSRGIDDEIHEIDWTGVYWRRS